MTRRKAPQGKLNKEKKPPVKSPLARKWLGWPFVAIGFLSAVAGLLTLIPRLRVDVQDSLDSTSPTQTVFALVNDGLLSVHDVNVDCRYDQLINKNGGGLNNVTVRFPKSNFDILSPDQEVTLPCDHSVGTSAFSGPGWREVGVTIVVSYRPAWVT